MHESETALLPVDEEERQDAVRRSGVLDRGRDAALNELVTTVSHIFRTPMAAISVIDRRRQWFVASTGLAFDQTPRSQSFCAHALHRPGELLVVPDATRDPRFSENPLVTGAPWIRFYAGKPLMTPDGYPLGTLCIIDDRPRDHSPDLSSLTLYALQAERLISGRA